MSEDIEALKRAALRYRFLRLANWTKGGMVVVAQAASVKLGHDTLTHERLDEAIDLALAGGRITNNPDGTMTVELPGTGWS